MKKTLRFLFVTLLAFCFANANAKDVVFDFNSDCATIFPDISLMENGISSSAFDIGETLVSASIDGVVLKVSPGSSETAPNRLWRTTKNGGKNLQLRMYGGTLTITSETPFASINFKYGKWGDGNTANVGTLDKGQWTGDATKEVVITIAKNTQLDKITISTGGEVTPPSLKEVNNISEFAQLNKGEEAKLKLTNAQVVYVNEYEGATTYFIRDASGALQFYRSTLGLRLGDILNGSVIGTCKPYFNVPELVEEGKTNKDELTITPGTAEPSNVNISDLPNAKYMNDFVKLTGVKITSDRKAVDDNGNEVELYNKYHVSSFDADNASPDKKYDVFGIVSDFNGIPKLYYTEIVENTRLGIQNAGNNQAETTAPVYNLSGQRVNENYKGVVIRNGRKYINK